jgi:hypothetical protein
VGSGQRIGRAFRFVRSLRVNVLFGLDGRFLPKLVRGPELNFGFIRRFRFVPALGFIRGLVGNVGLSLAFLCRRYGFRVIRVHGVIALDQGPVLVAQGGLGGRFSTRQGLTFGSQRRWRAAPATATPTP